MDSDIKSLAKAHFLKIKRQEAQKIELLAFR